MIIDGQLITNDIIEKLKEIYQQNNLKAKLTIFLWKDNIPGHIYVKNKLKKAEYIGIETNLIEFDNSVTEDKLYNMIKTESKDSHNYIILQLPVPKNFNVERLTNIIPPRQDIDGFCIENVAKLSTNSKPYNIPATAKAVEYLIKQYTQIENKNIVIIGRSNIVGKPLYNLLLKDNATVRIIHSKIKDIQKYTKEADILVSACGVPHLINSDHIKNDAIVIDVGINKLNDKIVGDVDFDSVLDKVSYITPVPKGVGPMTIAMLIENIINSETCINI